MERGSEIDVSLTIAGRGFDPSECTRNLAIAGSREWHQRLAHLRARKDLPDAAWILSTGWKRSDSVDDAVASLLETVWPKRHDIVEFSESLNLQTTVTVAVRVWTESPVYSLSVRTMERLVSLRAKIGFDIHDYREASEDA